MRSFKLFGCGIGVAVLLSSITPLFSGEKDSDKELKPAIPKADAQLLAAYKNFTKATGYKVNMTVVGGISDNPEHTVTNRVVSDTYNGEVYQNLMFVDNSQTFPFKAYRTPKKGVGKIDGMWRPTLAHPRGVRMERLFPFPSMIMDQAAKHAKTAQWLAGSVVEEEDEDEDDEDAESAAEDEDEGSNKASEKESDKEIAKRKTTAVKKTEKAEKARLASMPRVLRVEAPAKEALDHFTQVQNSGCVSGG